MLLLWVGVEYLSKIPVWIKTSAIWEEKLSCAWKIRIYLFVIQHNITKSKCLVPSKGILIFCTARNYLPKYSNIWPLEEIHGSVFRSLSVYSDMTLYKTESIFKARSQWLRYLYLYTPKEF